jgi:hypothetical protein
MKFKWLESKSNNNELPKNYQEAFTDVLNKLVFTEPANISITRENVKTISQKIQDEYIDLDDSLQTKRRAYLNNMFKIKEEEPKFSILAQAMDKPEKDFIEHMTMITGAYQQIDDGVQYYNWGFTPKLAQNANGKDIGRNCFGVTSFIGAACKKRGIKIDMGITPDHPYVVAYLDDGVYLADGQNHLQKVSGSLEEHGDYKIYRPTEEDKLLQKMIMIENFDDAVVYAVLENIEVLRQVSLGNKDITLPGSYEKGVEIATANKELLQKVDWKDVQKKLFPEIDKSFLDNINEWSTEVKKVSEHRKESFIQHLFIELSHKALSETSFKDKTEEELAEMGKLFQQHEKEILQFLKIGAPFAETIPDDIQKYFSSIKAGAEKQTEPGAIENLYKIIEEMLVDKTTEK